MSNPSTATRRVEELERFGKALNDAPDDIFKGQGKFVFAAFRKKFGLLGLLPFAWRVMRARRRLLRDYAPQYTELRSRVSPELAPDSPEPPQATALRALAQAVTTEEVRDDYFDIFDTERRGRADQP